VNGGYDVQDVIASLQVGPQHPLINSSRC
jgi:hypothetical protein